MRVQSKALCSAPSVLRAPALHPCISAPLPALAACCRPPVHRTEEHHESKHGAARLPLPVPSCNTYCNLTPTRQLGGQQSCAVSSRRGAQRRRRGSAKIVLRRWGRALALACPICPRIPVAMRLCALQRLVDEGAHLLVCSLFATVMLCVDAKAARLARRVAAAVVGAFVLLLVHGVHGHRAED